MYCCSNFQLCPKITAFGLIVDSPIVATTLSLGKHFNPPRRNQRAADVRATDRATGHAQRHRTCAATYAGYVAVSFYSCYPSLSRDRSTPGLENVCIITGKHGNTENFNVFRTGLGRGEFGYCCSFRTPWPMVQSLLFLFT